MYIFPRSPKKVEMMVSKSISLTQTVILFSNLLICVFGFTKIKIPILKYLLIIVFTIFSILLICKFGNYKGYIWFFLFFKFLFSTKKFLSLKDLVFSQFSKKEKIEKYNKKEKNNDKEN